MELSQLHCIVVGASARTNWTIVVATGDDGQSGYGESTLVGSERDVVAQVADLAGTLVGMDVRRALGRTRGRTATLGGLIAASALSGVNQALWDLTARASGQSLSVALGGEPSRVFALYANVNRSLLDRTPEAFGAAARAAVDQGFAAVKIAPFDEVSRGDGSALRRATSTMEPGLERVSAVREAVGAEAEVMVDCHWRFSPSTAVVAARELARLGIAWLEDPVDANDVEGWRRVRVATDLPLAGGENVTGPRQLHAFIRDTGVDIAMPDIKYCGGVDGMLECMTVARLTGAALSPHNPTGPVATLATAAALSRGEVASIEYQWHDGPELLPHSVLTSGALRVPDLPGIGLDLDEGDLLRRHPSRALKRHVSAGLI